MRWFLGTSWNGTKARQSHVRQFDMNLEQYKKRKNRKGFKDPSPKLAGTSFGIFFTSTAVSYAPCEILPYLVWFAKILEYLSMQVHDYLPSYMRSKASDPFEGTITDRCTAIYVFWRYFLVTWLSVLINSILLQLWRVHPTRTWVLFTSICYIHYAPSLMCIQSR